MDIEKQNEKSLTMRETKKSTFKKWKTWVMFYLFNTDLPYNQYVSGTVIGSGGIVGNKS